jgi:hypothetical protein
MYSIYMKWNQLDIKGQTLVEVSVAAAIGALVILAIASSMNYANLGFNTMLTGQAGTDFRSMLKMMLNNPATCNNSLRISLLTFTKTQDLYSSGGVNYYNANGVNYWPVTGNIDIRIDNLAVQAGSAYGSKTTSQTWPITLTLQSTGGNWTVSSCTSQTPTSMTNKGWDPSNTSDPAFCEQVAVPEGTVGTCPTGKYIVSSQPATSTTTQTTVVYSPRCDCVGTCKGCVCVVNSNCNTHCDSRGNSIITVDNCMGTCDPSGTCTPHSDTTTETTNTHYITCCKVQR